MKNKPTIVTEYGVWHPEFGIEICFQVESLAHDHLNAALMDEELFEHAKECHVVPITYKLPVKES